MKTKILLSAIAIFVSCNLFAQNNIPNTSKYKSGTMNKDDLNAYNLRDTLPPVGQPGEYNAPGNPNNTMPNGNTTQPGGSPNAPSIPNTPGIAPSTSPGNPPNAIPANPPGTVPNNVPGTTPGNTIPNSSGNTTNPSGSTNPPN